MYGWIWRKLPFGVWGKITGSLGLAAATAALLWYVVFPWATPLLPFDDVQVGSDTQQGPAQEDPHAVVSPSDGPDAIPYSTKSNAAEPSASKTTVVLPGD
jgi:hypothetical protein